MATLEQLSLGLHIEETQINYTKATLEPTLPQIPTYESELVKIQTAIAKSEQLINDFTPLNNAERIGLQTGLALALLLRPLIQNPNLAQSELLEVRGDGPDHNPHLAIDLLAGELIHRLVPLITQKLNQPFVARIEEEHAWVQINPDSTGLPELHGLFDPIDGTSELKKPLSEPRYIATGILIMDAHHNIQAGVVASLVDQRIIVVTQQGIYRIMYDELNNVVQFAFPTLRPWNNNRPLRFATLQRRMETLRQSDFWSKFQDHADLLPTFGGFALLETLFPQKSPQNLMLLDVHKGQPVYEPFAPIAQFAGLPALSPEGIEIDFQKHLTRLYQENDGERIPVIIYANSNVATDVPPALIMRSQSN